MKGKRGRLGRKETRQIEVAEEATGWTVGEKKLETATHLAGGTRRGGPETCLNPRLPMLDTINLTVNLTIILQYINHVGPRVYSTHPTKPCRVHPKVSSSSEIGSGGGYPNLAQLCMSWPSQTILRVCSVSIFPPGRDSGTTVSLSTLSNCLSPHPETTIGKLLLKTKWQ